MPRRGFARRVAGVAATIALAFGITACTADTTPTVPQPDQVDAALPDDVQQQLQGAVERGMAGTGSGGAIVGVWAPWAGTWVQAFGANPDGSAVDVDDTFKAGAVTRTMTCDVLYGLVADGVVALDDPVTDYLESMRVEESVTLGALCDSTSGLGTYRNALHSRWEIVPERSWSPYELLAYGFASANPGAAGTFLDSDAGYVLLGLALERAAGKTAPELFADYVFEPLGMAQSSLPSGVANLGLHGTQSALTPEGAVDCATAVDMSDLSLSAGFTAAGAVTDVTDLGRYIRSVAGGLRDYDTDARFADPLAAYDGAPAWFTARGGAYQAGTLVGQYGGILGYQTLAFADRESGLTVVVVLNNSRASDVSVRALGWELAAIASKAPAAAGEPAPGAGLPWTPEQMSAELASVATCPLP